MIKIIKYGNKRRIECGYCGSLLEYEQEDLETVQTGMNEWEKRIKCSICNEDILVSWTS